MVLAFALMGFTSIIGQVVLLRDLLVVFSGNELSVGAILAAWLLWVAAGSWGLPRLIRRRGSGTFAVLQAATFLILPLELVLARNIRNLAGTLPGEVIGFFPMLLWSFLTLAPLCLLLGWQFAAACEAAAPRWSIGQVYLYESLGSVGGGLLTHFVLLYHLDAWQMALGLGTLSLFSALMQAKRKILAPVFLLLVSMGLPTAAGFCQDLSLHQRWQGYNLVESRDSIYGNLAVTARGSQYSFFENGFLLATTQDLLAAEETAHYPLLEHPQPRRVLLIGGGINGTVREILKHPVERVDYVELDPTLIAAARRYLPPPDRQALDDSRVSIHHVDGRLFVQQHAHGEKYDVVILNAPHPFTAQVNRLYTLEFFQQVRRILRDDGILALVFISAENYASREMQALDASVYRTLREVWADVLVLPGDDAILLASPTAGVLSADPATLRRRWDQRGLAAVLTPSHLSLRLAPERIAYGRRVFDQQAPLNRDLQPISLYLDMVLWGSYFSAPLRDTLNAALVLQTAWPLTLLAGIGLGIVIYLRSRSRPLVAVPWSLAAIGFAGMTWEVMLVFAFQVFCGYIYHQIALIMAAFMAGLVLGSGWATRGGVTRRVPALWRWLLAVQGMAALYSLLMPLVLSGVSGVESSLAQTTLPLLMVIGGLVVGAAFPLAGAIVHKGEDEAGKTAGVLYAADLLGAAAGALLAGAVLIPILGLVQAALAVAAVNLVGFLLLASSSQRSER